MNVTRIAVLQMTSGIEPATNLRAIEEAAHSAADGNASVMFAPEMAVLLDRDRERAGSLIPKNEEILGKRLSEIARKSGVAICAGGPVRAGGGRLANRLWYCAPDAEVVHYDKMHLLDVDLASGERWRESSAYVAGDRVVAIPGTPMGKLGLGICYDIRFPALFDALGKAGCDAVAIPAAFTVPTGQAHWHVLVRARAIEASAFVIAAAQTGRHEDGRRTYGHSLVIDPWGEVLLDMGTEPGLAFVDCDLDRIVEAREQVPSLANRRTIPN